MNDFNETILVKVKKNVDTRAFSFDSLQNSGENNKKIIENKLRELSTLLQQKKIKTN